MSYPTENPQNKHDVHGPVQWADKKWMLSSVRAAKEEFRALVDGEHGVRDKYDKMVAVYSYPGAPSLGRIMTIVGFVRLSLVESLMTSSKETVRKCTLAVRRLSTSLSKEHLRNSEKFALLMKFLRRKDLVAVVAVGGGRDRVGLLSHIDDLNDDPPQVFAAHCYVCQIKQLKSEAEAESQSQGDVQRETALPSTDQSIDHLQNSNGNSTDLFLPGEDDSSAANKEAQLWQPDLPTAGGDISWDVESTCNLSAFTVADPVTVEDTFSNQNDNKKRKREEEQNGNNENDTDALFHKDKGAAMADTFYSNLERNLATRADSWLFHMRNFNGWIKATQIAECNPNTSSKKLRVMDLACGKGGDLGKWLLHSRGVENYVGIDVARGSLKDAAIRARNIQHKFTNQQCSFICADLGKDVPGSMQPLLTWKLSTDSGVGDPSFDFLPGGALSSQPNQFDVVSIQFAIHYMMSTEARAKRFFQSVSNLLDVGGKFIATTIDARVVVEQIMSLGQDYMDDLTTSTTVSVGNGACQLTFPPSTIRQLFSPSPSNEFGLEYTFKLVEGDDHQKGFGEAVDLPEWLTPIPVLEQLASEVGLELENATNFHHFYSRRQSPIQHSAAHNALYTMKVLNQNGSISQSEWEISRLYAALQFRKVRNVDNHKIVDFNSPQAKQLFPKAMCIAKKKVGDAVWNTYSTDQKKQHTHFELSNLIQK